MTEGPGTILTADDEEFLRDLSEYLEILANSTRLRILRLLERRPMDARSLSIETGTSYENTKKHLERLLSAGLVTRRPGLGKETSRGIHPVWEYSPVPGVIHTLQRDLGILLALPPQIRIAGMQDQVSTVRRRIAEELGSPGRILVVLGGEWDQKIIPLSSLAIALGRAEEGRTADLPGCEIVAFPPSYRSLTRISRPHALISVMGGGCLVEDCGSTGGTYINGKRIPDRKKAAVRDGDLIALSMGEFGVSLLFLSDKEPGDGDRSERP
ncbi:MAG TPA: FHA domain-containing protein [Methanolinea sp.]|nr:FHA domain-containing protein [Methanolinea sp.]HQK56649.1 FHA domain-containing protein [Methanolinea sp.]